MKNYQQLLRLYRNLFEVLSTTEYQMFRFIDKMSTYIENAHRHLGIISTAKTKGREQKTPNQTNVFR